MKQDFYDKKVIILDLNFWEIEQYTVDAKIYTKKLLKELTANQNVIITTDNTSFRAIEGIEELGLRVGYLVSNSGTTITNIANQKTINTGTIDPDIAIKICNFCVWNRIHFSLITDETIYPFNLSYWLIKKYKSDLSYLHRHKKETMHLTPDIKETLKLHPIRKIEIYFLQKNLHQRQKEMFKLISPFEKEIDYSINVSTLQILPKDRTKLNAIKTIIQMLELDSDLTKDGIYMAIDQYDPEISRNSYFSILKYELTDEIARDETNDKEVLPMGAVSWVKWFYNHEHLWHGDSEDRVKNALEKYKDCTIITSSLIALQNGKTKWINIEKTSQNQLTTELTRLSFWTQQVPQVFSTLKKYNWRQRKT